MAPLRKEEMATLKEFHWDGLSQYLSTFEFTPKPDAAKSLFESIMTEKYRLEAQYGKSPKYLLLGVTELMAIRSECVQINGYDAGDLTVFYGMIIVPVVLESFCNLAYDDAGLTRSIYLQEKDKIDK